MPRAVNYQRRLEGKVRAVAYLCRDLREALDDLLWTLQGFPSLDAIYEPETRKPKRRRS